MRIRQPNQCLSLAELRELIRKHKARGREIIKELKNLQAHWEKMQEYYEEWEADLNKIQDAINEASIEHKVPPQEIEEYDALEDLLGADQ